METSAIRSIGLTGPEAEKQIKPDERAERVALVQAARTVNEAQSYGPNSEVTFSLDRKTHKPILQIVDRATREVIQQLPPEYLLRMAAHLHSKG